MYHSTLGLRVIQKKKKKKKRFRGQSSVNMASGCTGFSAQGSGVRTYGSEFRVQGGRGCRVQVTNNYFAEM